MLIGLIQAGSDRLARSVRYFAILLAMCSLGLVNAAVHADKGRSMPAGLILSALVWLLALMAGWIGYTGVPTRGSA